MKPFDELSERGQLGRIHKLAVAALANYGLPADCPIHIVNHTENVTYAVDLPETGERRFMRVHRPGYHTDKANESELAWMAALRRDTDIVTPEAIPGLDGNELQIVEIPGIDVARRVVLFKQVRGRHPSEVELLGPFRRLGTIAATFHDHIQSWTRPGWFERQTWDFETTLGDKPNWGHWQDAPGVSVADRRLLDRAVEVIRRRLDAFGKGPDRFDMIHADLRLDNFLVEHGDPRILDFDDGGFSWFLYDFASAITVLEERADVPDLTRAWVEGYRTVRDLPEEHARLIPTIVMVRRIMMMGWIASHSETPLAKTLAAPYSEASVALARAYLDGVYLADIR